MREGTDETARADAMLREFHDTFGGPGTKTDDLWLRGTLHKEECEELVEALQEWVGALGKLRIRRGDTFPPTQDGIRKAVARELADVVYVAYGSALIAGIDLDAALAEVHRANMSKLGEDGKPILRDDGKVLKGPNFTPPDLSCALRDAAPTRSSSSPASSDTETRVELPAPIRDLDKALYIAVKRGNCKDGHAWEDGFPSNCAECAAVGAATEHAMNALTYMDEQSIPLHRAPEPPPVSEARVKKLERAAWAAGELTRVRDEGKVIGHGDAMSRANERLDCALADLDDPASPTPPVSEARADGALPRMSADDFRDFPPAADQAPFTDPTPSASREREGAARGFTREDLRPNTYLPSEDGSLRPAQAEREGTERVHERFQPRCMRCQFVEQESLTLDQLAGAEFKCPRCDGTVFNFPPAPPERVGQETRADDAAYLRKLAADRPEGSAVAQSVREIADRIERESASVERVGEDEEGARVREIWICPRCEFVAGDRKDIIANPPWCGPCHRQWGYRTKLIAATLSYGPASSALEGKG